MFEDIGIDKRPHVAFFGATGGCTLAALELTLESGRHARALVRTPQKLFDLLDSRGIPPATVKDRLTIIGGNAKDGSAVEKTLVDENGRLVDQIVFGIGGVPKFTPNPLQPTLDDPKVCQTAMATVISSLENIYSRMNRGHAQQKPILTAVSTTGISPKRDIPITMIPLYHWLLPIPHADKKIMEELVEKAAARNVIRGYVIVRPSLLTDGKRLGLTGVRVGLEKEDGTGAAVGYTISRDDVGSFIFEKVILKDAEGLRNRKVSLTY